MRVGMEERLPIQIGIDIGQLHDPTAICIAEVFQVDTGKVHYSLEQSLGYLDKYGEWVPPKGMEPVMVTEYTIRHIARLPLGTPYPDVATHIADLLCHERFAHRRVRALLDSTGVGKPIYDDVRKEIALRKEAREVSLQPISFVHGEKYNRTTGTLGKAYLVSKLQSLLQGGRVHAPDTAEVKATLEELRVYEIKVDTGGKDTYGAVVGKHDDLATALALSCLEDPYAEKITYSKRIF